MAKSQLLEIIGKKISNLTKSEKKLIAALPTGRFADFTHEGEELQEPCKVEGWSKEKVIRAEVITAICITRKAHEYIHPKGLQVRGVMIDGLLDLENVNFPFPLRFNNSLFKQEVCLPYSKVTELDFSGCCTTGIYMRGLTIRGRLLLTDGFHSMGEIQASKSAIEDYLDCEGARFENPDGYAILAENMKVGGGILFRKGFEAKGEVRLNNGEVGQNLECDNGKFENPDGTALDATGMKVGGSIFLRNGFEAKGEVRLNAAEINGVLDCKKGRFEKSDGFAILAENMKVGGSIFLRNGFEAKGEVRLYAAEINGVLDCGKGKFENKNGYALEATGMKVGGFIFFHKDFEAKGGVNLYAAEVIGSMVCENGKFENPNGYAINAENMKVGGYIFLRKGFEAKGGVRLYGGEVGQNLECDNGKFENPDGTALDATGLKVGGSISLRNGFEAKGEVRLYAAEINGVLDCKKGKFEKPNGFAILAENMKVGGSILLRYGFEAKGEVRLFAVVINGTFDCENGKFENPDGFAILAENMKVGGSILLRNGFEARGEITLLGAKVNGNLVIFNSLLSNPEGVAFNGSNMQIRGTFFWLGLKEKPIGDISLVNAHAAVFEDDPDSWPDTACIRIEGFQYDNISSATAKNLKNRLHWLDLQDPEHFSTQPYEQLMNVYRSLGLVQFTKEVGIAKQKSLQKHGNLSVRDKIWKWILGFIVDYGYNPQKAFRWMLFFIFAGSILFNNAYNNGLMASDQKETSIVIDDGTEKIIVFPGFNSIVYSIDSFIPIVNLQQEDYWLPNNNLSGGYPYLIYYWVHIGAGWFLTTLSAAAITGIVKKD